MKKIYKYASFIMLFFNIFSCSIKLPIKYNFEEKITITEEENRKLQESLINYINKKIGKFTSTALPSPKDCKDAFIRWLENRFQEGMIPKKDISALEYAKDENNLHTCPSIPLERIVTEAARKITNSNTTNQNIKYPLSESRENFAKDKCLEPFLDPKEERIEIQGLYMTVIKNTLNYPTSQTSIYVTTEDISDDRLKESNLEQTLKKEGKLKPVGLLTEVSPGREGKVLGTLVEGKDLIAAQELLTPLNTNLIFFRKPQTISNTVIDGVSYYLVPKGEVTIILTIAIGLKGKLSDAQCYWDEKKKELEAKDKELKENYDKNNK